MIREIVLHWLKTRVRAGKISRNTIAVGLVVLDQLLRQCPIEEEALFSKGGELKGSRSGLSGVFRRYGIPPRFLKEATTRQAHQDARILAEELKYGKILNKLSASARERELRDGIALLVSRANEWLSKQPIKVNCDRQLSPLVWVGSILERAKGRSGGVVEQHLIGAKLQERYPELKVPNYPGHAGDVQTKRSSDFPLLKVDYHVTATDGKEAIARCRENVESGTHPVLLVPKRHVTKAQVYAEIAGISDRVSVMSIEDFITQNIIEIATQENEEFFVTLKRIIDEYNRRLAEVETDMSLKIELS